MIRSTFALAALLILILLTACGPGAPGPDSKDLPPPPPDTYPKGPDWTMFQGNASHTGYVPVTLAPLTFRESYAVKLSDTALNAVACAGDWVFVTNHAYYTPSMLFEVNPRGGRQWEYSFGSIYGVNSPAYDKGKVFVQTSGHSDAYLYAFDYKEGALDIRMRIEDQWSTYYSPTIYDDIIYTPGGYYHGVYALCPYDRLRPYVWITPLQTCESWTPAVDNDHIYAFSYEVEGFPYLTVLDRATGLVDFEIPDTGHNASGFWLGAQAPVIGSRGNILATNFHRLLSFDLDSRSLAYGITEDFYGQVTLANGTLYVKNGERIDARAEADGTLLWTWSPPAEDPAWLAEEAMLATDNLLFVSCAKPDYSPATYVGKTFAVDLVTHQTVWTYDLGGHLALSASGSLIIAAPNGTLAAIKVK